MRDGGGCLTQREALGDVVGARVSIRAVTIMGSYLAVVQYSKSDHDLISDIGPRGITWNQPALAHDRVGTRPADE